MHSTTQPNRPKIAETVIHPTANIRDSSIGRCCEILADTSLHTAELGDFSYLGPRCIVGDATIGKFCAIAAEVRIGAPNHPMDRPSMHRFTYCPEYYAAGAVRDHAFFDRRKEDRAVIGNDVWIGHGVIVLPGVKAGNGAVLAAGAVVSKDVQPYTVVGGIPAKFIRERFTRTIAERLTSIAWWDWPFETIMERLADFQSSDIEAFCERWS
ncbi:LbetaH domain-containing protein [Rhizobium dioscoreae]|nr:MULTISPECIES: acetyltransferase [Rhizobium]